MAGTAKDGYNGDHVNATAATLADPFYVAPDKLGNIYIADQYNHRIRFVSKSTGIITTVAGTGVGGYNGDNILATLAQLNRPCAVAIDITGNLYISDTANNRIRLVNKTSGMITTVAGNGIGAIFGGDNIRATLSTVNDSFGLVPDAAGNLYISDSGANRIRFVNGSTGIITTIAGTGVAEYNGDNILASSASLNYPGSICLDDLENVYISDYNNHRVRLITRSTGIITTVAGTGSPGYNGDNVLATSALVNRPEGIALDIGGNLYIADGHNHRIRLVTKSTGIITTIAGNGTIGYNGDNIQATSAILSYPAGINIDEFGTLYIADEGNQRIRTVTLWTSQPTRAPTSMPSAVPTSMPSVVPTSMPSDVPTSMPSDVPTSMPSDVPTSMPSAVPTSMPSAVPTSMPSAVPTSMPSAVPTSMPSAVPTSMPSAIPTSMPSAVPTTMPSEIPSVLPSFAPSYRPSFRPTLQPTSIPSPVPSAFPSAKKANAAGSPFTTQPPTASPSGYNFTHTRACFAGSETVLLESGDVRALSDIRIGDRILTAKGDGETLYSSVVFIPHAANKESTILTHISTLKGHDLRMTDNHILPAGVCGTSLVHTSNHPLSLPLVYASKIAVGDCVRTVSGEDVVVKVESVRAEGVYTIVTNEEFIVVNGIVASSFGVNHMIGNLYYNVHRFVYLFCPSVLSSPLIVTANEVSGQRPVILYG